MTIDLTSIIVAIIGAVGTMIGAAFLAWLQSHIKDKDARDTLDKAFQNAMGAMQQSAASAVTASKPSVTVSIPGISPDLARGVQYVIDNASKQLARLPENTPEVIADKLSARIGVKNIETNIAAAASPAAVIPDPLGPVPVTAPQPTPDPTIIIAPIPVAAVGDQPKQGA